MNEKSEEEIRRIKIVVEGETFRSGTSTGRRLIPKAKSGNDDDQKWINAAETVFSNYRTHEGIRHKNDNEGDELTLGELIDRNNLTVEAIIRQRHLNDFDIQEQLSQGDFIKAIKLRNGDPQDPEYGVVKEVSESFKGNARSKISVLTAGKRNEQIRRSKGKLLMGIPNMMDQLYDFTVLSKDDDKVTDELREHKKQVHESIEKDEKAENLSVEVESEWTTSGAVEAERASDQHAKLRIKGDILEEPVTVKVRNAFDIGWTAHIEDEHDLTEEQESIVKRAARKNSPFTTNMRM